MATILTTQSAIRWGLAIVAAAGLVVDAWVHFDLASSYDGIASSTLTQGDLFRAEAVGALVAAVGVLLRPRRYTAAFAFLVAAGGTAAVLVYAHVDVGAFGPFPNMYDPIWYPEKTLSAWAEGIAAVAALALFVMLQTKTRRGQARSAVQRRGVAPSA